MKNEFVTYEQALALKELGFDEPCWAWWHIEDCDTRFCYSDQRSPIINSRETEVVGLPLYQQAFRWFREKYNLHAEITWNPSYEYDSDEWSDAIYEITITNVSYTKELVAESPDMQRANGKQLTYEGAEQACLDKLIEIVKDGKREI